MNSFNSMKNNMNVLNATYGTFAKREELKPFLVLSGYYTANVTLYNSSGTSFATLPNSGSSDIFIAKYDAAGIGIWATRISSTGTDYPVNMILDSTNNVYISGYYTANVTLYNSSGTSFATLTNAGSNDIFIAKYNAAGIGIWATRISSTSSTGTDIPVNMILDSTNNVYISGYYTQANISMYNSSGTSFRLLTNAGSNDIFIAKYNAAGIGIWATQISSTGGDVPANMILDSTNNVYISGYYTQANVWLYNSSGTAFATLTNAGNPDIFIAKYNAAGIGIWATRISSTGTDIPVNMILDSTNNVYISGYFNAFSANVTLFNSSGTTFKSLPNSGSSDIFIAKYDAAGIGIWATRISSTGIDVPLNMILDSTNNVYISGYYYQATLYLYNSSGTSFKTLTNAGVEDIFIAKYDAAGIGIWATRISSNGGDLPLNMRLDSTNNVYISGYYAANAANVTLYNSSGTTFKSLPNAGNQDIFIAKYDGAGIGIWATQISSTGGDVPANMILDSTNNVYISGYYTQANVSLYNSSGTSFKTLTNAGVEDTIIAKYDADGIGIWATRISGPGSDRPLSMILKK